MASIASKNLYELLGNDPELDPDRPADPPTKVAEHAAARLGKRNAPAEAPSQSTGSVRGAGNDGRRANGATGSERAYNDRNAGSAENRRRAPDDGLRQDRHPDRIRADRGEYRGRGRGRGASGGGGNARTFNPSRPDDRRSKTGVVDHEKQLAHGWGGNSGTQEYDDEKAGEAIAKEEEKQGFDTTIPAPVDADGNPLPDSTEAAPESAEPAEPEGPKTKGYEEYLAEIAEKKLALGSLDIRKPNEGASKKFPEGKAFAREEQQDFFVGGGEKKSRERTKKEQKQTVELDSAAMRPAQQDDRPRGGRGGGRGRGGDRDRGDRPDRPDRPERREPREPREPREGGERGERADRGDRPRGGGRGRGGDRPRGEFRGGRGGGRGGGPSGPNIGDSSAFPSLGA